LSGAAGLSACCSAVASVAQLVEQLTLNLASSFLAFFDIRWRYQNACQIRGLFYLALSRFDSFYFVNFHGAYKAGYNAKID